MQEQTHDISDVPTDDDALREAGVFVRSIGDDAWYEHRGEKLFSDGRILDLWDRYQQMAETEWERVQTLRTRPETSRVKVRTQDIDELTDALNDRANEVNEDFGFIFQLSSLTGIHHGIHEEGPRKSVAWADYATGGRAFMGGPEHKRDKLLQPIRSFEQWYYHTNVWLPVVEEFGERYPY